MRRSFEKSNSPQPEGRREHVYEHDGISTPNSLRESHTEGNIDQELKGDELLSVYSGVYVLGR